MAELQPWVERIRTVSKHARMTFVITNNHYQGKGVVNALQIRSLLQGKPVRVPPSLLWHYTDLQSIATQTEDNEEKPR
jgi:uncharacterized protein YecE (DUF72 family)